MTSEDSSKKQENATSKIETPPEASSNQANPITNVAFLNLALDETGSFRICTSPDCAKGAVDVLNKLSERDRELWTRRFTPSCVERILNASTVDDETKRFFSEVAKKLRDL